MTIQNSDCGSITRCLGDLRNGDAAAAQPLWERYYDKLVRRARSKMIGMGCPRTTEDEEDVALSALDSVCQGLQQGRFPQLMDRDGLWRLLVCITLRKSIDRYRKQAAHKRHGVKVSIEANLMAAQGEDPSHVLDRIACDHTPPELLVIVAEELRQRIESLGENTLIRIAELKMEDHTNQEIADHLGCSLRTVTLKLELIRRKWSPELAL
jgi:DNA-directed RNA polymerase specialized sigma24 family protein